MEDSTRVRKCSVIGCGNLYWCRGYCSKHYYLAVKEGRLAVAHRTQTTVERFWRQVDKNGPIHPVLGTACWLWTGSTFTFGYGSFKLNPKKSVHAYRFAYELIIGRVPNGLHLDHLCRNPVCLNPKHLEPVTPLENMMRGNGFAAQNARKTHCPNGHVYDKVSPTKTGTRRDCSICRNSAKRRRRREIQEV